MSNVDPSQLKEDASAYKAANVELGSSPAEADRLTAGFITRRTFGPLAVDGKSPIFKASLSISAVYGFPLVAWGLEGFGVIARQAASVVIFSTTVLCLFGVLKYSSVSTRSFLGISFLIFTIFLPIYIFFGNAIGGRNTASGLALRALVLGLLAILTTITLIVG